MLIRSKHMNSLRQAEGTVVVEAGPPTKILVINVVATSVEKEFYYSRTGDINNWFGAGLRIQRANVEVGAPEGV